METPFSVATYVTVICETLGLDLGLFFDLRVLLKPILRSTA